MSLLSDRIVRVGSLSLLVFLSHPSQGKDLKSYLGSYMAVSESHQIQVSKKHQAEQQKIITDDVFQSRLSVSPTWQNSTLTSYAGSVETSEESDTSQSLGLTLSQKSPWGLVGQLSVEKSLDEDDFSSTRTDLGWSAALTTSLRRDFLGSSTRSNQLKAGAHWESAKWLESDQLMSSCIEGINFYTTAYIEQEKLKATQKVLKLAEQSLGIAKNAYKRKLIRKIDSLALQSEALRIRSRFHTAQQRAFESLTRMTLAAGIVAVAELKDPERALKVSQSTEKGVLNSPELRAREYDVESAQWDLAYNKNQSKSEVSLGLEYSSVSGEVLSGSTFNDYKDRTLMLELTWDWEWWNSELAATRSISLEAHKQAQLRLRATRKKLEEEFQDLMHQRTVKAEVVQLLTEQVQLLEEQVREGLRLLRAGKFNINDYINYQDRLLTERLNLLVEKNELWHTHLRLAQLQGHKQEVCLGVL
tara:strand:+ start:51 stop:1469 length:1419 start_codon:yes stop_codon:yes gene_type:complete